MVGFDTTPKPAFLRAMQNQRWTVTGALAELVDNSFGPGRGNADTVDIIHDTKARTISVIDNGRGMQAIGRLFQLGNTIGRSPGDIGMYGSGGTMAVLWLASRVDIWTLVGASVAHDTVDWSEEIRHNRFPVISEQWRHATAANTPAVLLNHGQGTMIKLHLLKERIVLPSNVKRDLAKLYAPGLRLGKRLLWTTTGKNAGTDILADPLLLPADEDRLVRIELGIQVGDEVLTVDGMIGVIEDLPLSQSNVTVGYGPRVITTTRDCYSSPDGEERFSGVGVAGWLDLGEGWQPYLSTTKDVMNDRPVWDRLMGFIFEKIRHLLQLVDEQKLWVELDDLAIMLEKNLGGIAQLKLLEAAAETSERDRKEKTDRGEETGTPERERQTPPAAEDGESSERDAPASTRIKITPLSDTEMEQLLCSADISRDLIEVFVNKDHDLIKAAMVARPINRDLLHMSISTAIAGELVDRPEVTAHLFPRSIVRLIDSREGRQREGIVVRILIDKTRRAA
jgi:hypothetical protein